MPRRHVIDILFVVFLLVVSAVIQHGRIGSSLNGVDLTTDPAMYAAMAAALDHPEAFARDDNFSDPALFDAHATIHMPLIRRLAAGENYGLAYLKLTGVHVFLHYVCFYLLGLKLLKKRWQAMLFTLLMGQVYWIPWGTYWGNGYPDYTPRSTFSALYAVYICVALALLDRPRWWPVFMAATGLLVYVHSISALPAALGFWLGFALRRPAETSRLRHAGWLFFCGLCFVVVMAPFALNYLKPGVPLSSADVDTLRDALRARFDPEFSDYWQGIGRYFLHLIVVPLFPLALAAAWFLHRRGTAEERILLGQIGMWTLGVAGVVLLFIADQEAARLLHRQHFEFDLIRVLRFPVFFAICLIFLGLNVLLRLVPPGNPKILRNVRLLWAAVFLGLFFGGQHDMARRSLAWYWNSLDPTRYAAAYGPQLSRAAMIEALKTHTEPSALLFYPREDQAIRYNALRSLTYGWKDACLFYYAKATDKLRRWDDIRCRLAEYPTAYIDLAHGSDADYLLSDRPEDLPLLKRFGTVVWFNDRYVLVKRGNTAPDADAALP